jgi:hypothetical protein
MTVRQRSPHHDTWHRDQKTGVRRLQGPTANEEPFSPLDLVNKSTLDYRPLSLAG